VTTRPKSGGNTYGSTQRISRTRRGGGRALPERTPRGHRAVGKTSLALLQRYDWPGNVRELRNVLERAMILSPGPMLRVDPPAMPALLSGSKAANPSTDGLEDVEREHILRVLGEVEWRIKGADSASVRLRMKPSTLRSPDEETRHCPAGLIQGPPEST
jgi:DNA-binding NtrC family response regulator